jgi:hypothetical protein
MKSKPHFLALSILFQLLFNSNKIMAQNNLSYYSQYVDLKGDRLYGSDEPLWLILINKYEDRIKTKYFASAGGYGSISDKFNAWKENKKIIMYASGSYTGGLASTPVGLTIDNGILVNRNIEQKGYDGLVVVFPSGKIDVLNLKFTLTLDNGTRQYDIQHNEFDKNDFISWAIAARFTVFQTHLLVFKNQLCFSQFGSSIATASNRRFLACGINSNNQTINVIINDLHRGTLYERSRIALDILQNQEGLNVAWMINLDTGAKDVFQGFNEQGLYLTHYTGTTPLSSAINLIVYYYDN